MDSGRNSVPDDVIIIDDDNGVSEVEDIENLNSANMSFDRSHRAQVNKDSEESDFSLSELSSSDEEDCVVLEQHPTPTAAFCNKSFSTTRKRSRVESCDYPDELSDCEVIADVDGKIRKEWEEAAIRRRMANSKRVQEEFLRHIPNPMNHSRFRAKSEESTSVSIHHDFDADQNSDSKQCSDAIQDLERVKDSECCRTSADGLGTKAGIYSRMLFHEHPHGSEARSEGTTEEDSITGNIPSSTVETTGLVKLSTDNSSFLDEFKGVGPSGGSSDTHVESGQTLGTDKSSVGTPNIVIDKERLKETEEFQNADAEEWARRHEELQKQAQEAQRERKRRKIEGERRLEMENRQKQRLEEIRQSQLKEEQTSGYKELVRGRIQCELEYLIKPCRDMASLLRRLGIPVDGEEFPSSQQVNAAYKKALLRFHPDRVSAMDIPHQVKAEETFKLISKMKGILPLIAT